MKTSEKYLERRCVSFFNTHIVAKLNAESYARLVALEAKIEECDFLLQDVDTYNSTDELIWNRRKFHVDQYEELKKELLLND